MENNLLARIKSLKLYGLLAHFEEIAEASWVPMLLEWEENERVCRSLERRTHQAKLGSFKPISEFDWDWPRECDRAAIEELMQLSFIKESRNVIFCGSNGAGKTTLAKNIAHYAMVRGFNVLFVPATEMLNQLAAEEGAHALQRRIKYYVHPQLLLIDEVGYLSYSNRYADLFFEIVSRRYHDRPTMITTNKPFSEWNQIFPNASCVVSLIDRLVHCSEIISIDSDSYRLKEATEEALKRNKERALRKNKSKQKEQEVKDGQKNI